jgi:hypothetical protein
LDSEVVEEASSDAYEAAIAKVSDMFDYLKTLITRTWGGEKGRVSVDDRAKRMAVSHLRNVMKMLDPESVSESVMSDYIGVKKRSSGNYDLDELLTAMRDKIVSMIAELRNSAVIDTIKHSKGEIMGGIKGIGTDLRRLRTGDQGVTDVEEARYNLQDLANSLSPNEVIYYKSANGTNVPAAVDPSNHESLESLLNLIMKGGSSQVVVAEKGKPKKGRAVDLNRTGRVAQIRSDRMGVQ